MLAILGSFRTVLVPDQIRHVRRRTVVPQLFETVDGIVDHHDVAVGSHPLERLGERAATDVDNQRGQRRKNVKSR